MIDLGMKIRCNNRFNYNLARSEICSIECFNGYNEKCENHVKKKLFGKMKKRNVFWVSSNLSKKNLLLNVQLSEKNETIKIIKKNSLNFYYRSFFQD